jgi:LysM repeat protein
MRAHRTLTATAATITLAFLALLSTGPTHTVHRGETLAGIANRYGTTTAALARANGISNPNLIFAGDELTIPAGAQGTGATTTYRVRAGDTLGSIAARHGTSIATLVAANGIENANLIRIGQVLKVAAGTGGSVSAPTAPVGGATHHVVQRGDTIGGVARRYGISQQQLIDANGLTNGMIYVGQRLLLVPAGPSSTSTGGSSTHTVSRGETLSGIAQRYGTTVRAITQANKIADPDTVRIGTVLTIPSTAGAAGVRCPVEGGARFMNDWGFPRSGGRFHEGNDLFAPRGTPVVAVVSGNVVQVVGRIGGNQLKLAGDDGVSYYYTHLDRFGTAGRVAAGTVIGYVGNSGNAAGGPTHVHFEVHPGGGEAVNPYPRFAGVC